MRTVTVFDENGAQLGILYEATVQSSLDRHAVSGGYVGGYYEEATPLDLGHYRPVTLKDNERTYLQCWLHAKSTLQNKLHAVFSFTTVEGTPLPKATVSHH